MSTKPTQNTSKDEEIDLLNLIEKTGEYIKKIFLGLINMVVSILVFLLRKWYYLVIAVVITGICALILDRISDPLYTTDLIMRSNGTTNQPIMSSINKLGEYANTDNYESLAKELNLSIEDASLIKTIATYWYYDIGEDGIYDGIDTERKFLSDTNVVKVDNEFVIRMTIVDPSVINRIEDGLVDYLEFNPLFTALNEQRLSDLKALINQTEYEIEKLDSLQKREYYTNSDDLRQMEGQLVFTSEKVIQTYHNDMFRLLQLKQSYESDLNVYHDVVTIVESFAVPSKEDYGAVNYAKKLVWYVLGLAILAAVLITYRKKIWIR